MGQPDESYQQMRDIWDDYHRRQEFEHSLIDRKTTWLLTTQSILFAAYGLTFGTVRGNDDLEDFRAVVARLGVSIAAIVLLGVAALIISKWLSWWQYRRFFRLARPTFYPLDRKELQWGVKTKITPFDLIPDVLLPIAFIVAWTALA